MPTKQELFELACKSTIDKQGHIPTIIFVGEKMDTFMLIEDLPDDGKRRKALFYLSGKKLGDLKDTLGMMKQVWFISEAWIGRYSKEEIEQSKGNIKAPRDKDDRMEVLVVNGLDLESSARTWKENGQPKETEPLREIFMTGEIIRDSTGKIIDVKAHLDHESSGVGSIIGHLLRGYSVSVVKKEDIDPETSARIAQVEKELDIDNSGVAMIEVSEQEIKSGDSQGLNNRIEKLKKQVENFKADRSLIN